MILTNKECLWKMISRLSIRWALDINDLVYPKGFCIADGQPSLLARQTYVLSFNGTLLL